MSDDDESQHPFAITSELPDDFGYTAGFLNGTLKFDFTLLVAAATQQQQSWRSVLTWEFDT